MIATNDDPRNPRRLPSCTTRERFVHVLGPMELTPEQEDALAASKPDEFWPERAVAPPALGPLFERQGSKTSTSTPVPGKVESARWDAFVPRQGKPGRRSRVDVRSRAAGDTTK